MGNLLWSVSLSISYLSVFFLTLLVIVLFVNEERRKIIGRKHAGELAEGINFFFSFYLK